MKKNIYYYFQKEAHVGALSQNTFKTQGLIFLSIFLTLLFFEPYILNSLSLQPRLILIVGYSISACFSFAISYSLFAPYNKPKWTNLLDIGMFFTCFVISWLLCYSYTILHVELLFTNMYNLDAEIKLPNQFLLYLFVYTMGTGCFILLLLRAYDIYLSHDRFSEKISEFKTTELPNIQARKIYKDKTQLVLIGKNKNERLTMSVDQFIYAKSEGHYVKIIYLHEKTKKQKFYTLRNKISTIETQLSYFDSIFRCHQSYIINLHYLKSVIGNKNKAYARLIYSENIPISNTYFEYLNKNIKDKEKTQIKKKTK